VLVFLIKKLIIARKLLLNITNIRREVRASTTIDIYIESIFAGYVRVVAARKGMEEKKASSSAASNARPAVSASALLHTVGKRFCWLL
jgi:hypothetical protein